MTSAYSIKSWWYEEEKELEKQDFLNELTGFCEKYIPSNIGISGDDIANIFLEYINSIKKNELSFIGYLDLKFNNRITDLKNLFFREQDLTELLKLKKDLIFSEKEIRYIIHLIKLFHNGNKC